MLVDKHLVGNNQHIKLPEPRFCGGDVMHENYYKPNITAGSLLVPQSRKIAKLLLTYPDKMRWKTAINDENILQQRSPVSASKLAALIKARLELATPTLWELVAEGDSTTSTHAIFACAIKHCRLLGDFLDLVVRDQFRRYEESLSYRQWDDFIEECKQRDLNMADFKPTTAVKVRSNIFQILYEVGYIKDRRKKELQKVHIAHEVIEYLEKNNEKYILRCIQL